MKSFWFSAPLALLIGAVEGQSRQQQTCSKDCAQRALDFAYTYGLPLRAYADFSKAYANVTANQFYHQRELAKPGDLSVVRPNADTVYSASFIDISSSDLIVALPEFDSNRYTSLSFYDPYGNNYANIGTTLNSSSGEYLIRFDRNNYGVQLDDVKGGFEGYVNSPTPYGLMLIRIMATNNQADIEKVNAIQNKVNLTERLRFDAPLAPALNMSMFSDPYYVGSSNGTTYQDSVMRLTAKLSPYNQPIVQGDQSWVTETLENAGIVDGRFTAPENGNLTLAAAHANISVTSLLTTPGTLIPLGNNWTSRAPRLIGNYYSSYTMRYYLGIRGYLAMTVDQAVYPSLSPNIELKEGQSALFHFPSKPKILTGGFWSLTAYGTDNFLIPNSLNRYTVGDRSNMTFPDGIPLSDEAMDGPFEVLLQPADIKPPANWTSNWLPIGPGGGTVSPTLRWYGASEFMSNGSYVHPRVEIIEALRA